MQTWIGVLAMKTSIKGTIGPIFTRREKDLNDIRVLECTVMDELVRGQCYMRVTSCKIDDKMVEGSEGRMYIRLVFS